MKHHLKIGFTMYGDVRISNSSNLPSGTRHKRELGGSPAALALIRLEAVSRATSSA